MENNGFDDDFMKYANRKDIWVQKFCARDNLNAVAKNVRLYTAFP